MATELRPQLDALLAELEDEEMHSVAAGPVGPACRPGAAQARSRESPFRDEILQRKMRLQWKESQLDSLLAEISLDKDLTGCVGDIGSPPSSPVISPLDSPLLGDAITRCLTVFRARMSNIVSQKCNC